MVANTDKIKVALSGDFLTSFASIPRRVRSKVLDFINKFMTNPYLPGLNYEKILNAKDKNLRSVRIDQSYRGIVLTPEGDNVHVLLWVDSHDKAYRWAENKLHTINPATGSLQIIDAEKAEISMTFPAVDDTDTVPEVKSLFDTLTDLQLMSLGVPELLLGYVRSFTSEEDLEKAEQSLPQEAFEALYLFVCGYTLDEICRELEKKVYPEKSFDTGDFESALKHEDSRRRFFVVEDELELAAILNAPLEKWRIFLHPSQRRLIERSWSGPVRVLGGAGTGKTVVAMHRARWLAESIKKSPGHRILFTTFTKNLAADIRQSLYRLCPDLMGVIEVVNLDKWVSDFLSRQGYPYQIDYGKKTKALWNRALTFIPKELPLPHSFYREEWERIIQPQCIATLDEYLKASRTGRGIKLSQKDRKSIWSVFEDYRLSLDIHRLREADDAMRDARSIIENEGTSLPYRAVIVDEGQDLSAQAFRLIRAMIPGEGENDLFITGDGHQCIYRHRHALSACGINVRGRSRKLRINYRTTEETSRWATKLLEDFPIDDLDGGIDIQKGCRALLHGAPPLVKHFINFRHENEYIARYLDDFQQRGGDLREICLVARTSGLIESYSTELAARGIKICRIGRSEEEDPMKKGLRCATIHRVKGLEFDRIIIAGVNKGIIPYRGKEKDTEDSSSARESEMHERALFYVAATRARKEVLVTSFGSRSEFLRSMPGDSDT